MWGGDWPRFPAAVVQRLGANLRAAGNTLLPSCVRHPGCESCIACQRDPQAHDTRGAIRGKLCRTPSAGVGADKEEDWGAVLGRCQHAWEPARDDHFLHHFSACKPSSEIANQVVSLVLSVWQRRL